MYELQWTAGKLKKSRNWSIDRSTHNSITWRARDLSIIPTPMCVKQLINTTIGRCVYDTPNIVNHNALQNLKIIMRLRRTSNHSPDNYLVVQKKTWNLFTIFTNTNLNILTSKNTTTILLHHHGFVDFLGVFKWSSLNFGIKINYDYLAVVLLELTTT